MQSFPSVAIPLLAGYTEHTKGKVCNLNCAHLESLYVAFLLTEDIINSDTTFNQFMDHYNINICPCGDIITYSDGDMHCSGIKKMMMRKEKGMIIVYNFYRNDWMNRATWVC